MRTLDDDLNADTDNTQDQYLLFVAGGELYAMEALKAQEIVEYISVTKVPMMNSFIKGVTNIRGNIVAVVDLVDRFELSKTKVSDKTSIVVINYKKNDVTTQIGIMIDEVYEVDTIEKSNIKNAPEFGAKIDSKYILNMGKYENKYIPILNMDTILNVDELSTLSSE
ncbi:chemotaxis protein CheW [Sulfurimonas autotrophica]|uniref:CheW protein n=1 Tax=Sulfurimonas autotrophica (strain ATCC BAA-671 / DSM 16294 / JCM 11897 / OK10) TaxID=563040 RepID=E0US03_SULAO|nr:chemotaxis protein CheW [Sulfurimonas autotrophica]ADN09026.1 CheW protein [Sulfurimonas autotrophica DSM 16294]